MGADVKHFAVYAPRKDRQSNTPVWVPMGVARLNGDGTISISLEALPLDGKLLLRETGNGPGQVKT